MIEQILPDICRIGGRSWDGVQASLSTEADANVYLLRAGDAGALVDCGSGGARAILEKNIGEADLPPEAITDLVLTHSHFDHTEGAADWQEHHELTTHLSSVGAELIARGDHRLIGYQVCEPPVNFRTFRVDHAVRDGERFALCRGRVQVQAVHLPGHTPDSTLFLLDRPGRRVGFCGDISFGRNREGNLGNVGWLNKLWGSNPDQYRRSLTKFLDLGVEVMLPGHGQAVVGANAVREAISASLDTIQRLLDSGLCEQCGL